MLKHQLPRVCLDNSCEDAVDLLDQLRNVKGQRRAHIDAQEHRRSLLMTRYAYCEVDRAWKYVGIHSRVESTGYTYVCLPITADSGEDLKLGTYPQAVTPAPFLHSLTGHPSYLSCYGGDVSE